MSDCLQNEDSIVSDLSSSNADTLTGTLDSGNNVNSEISIVDAMVSSISDGDSTDSNLGDNGSLYSELGSGSGGGVKYTGQETDNIVITVDNNVYTISASLRPIRFDSVTDFPQVGSERLIYIDFSNKTLYGWDSTKSVYYKLVADISSALANYVPNTRKINGKVLNSDVDLTADDVGALSIDTKLFSGDYNDLRNKPTIPTEYIKDAIVTDDILTLEKQDGTKLQFEGGGGAGQIILRRWTD